MMRIVAFALSFFVFIGCDTRNNVADPIDSYFIKYYGTEGDQEGVDMVANPDGTFTLLGTSILTDGNKQIYLVKVDGRGKVLWERFYGGPQNETAVDIEPILDGRYVILTNIENPASGTDIEIITVDQNGENPVFGSFSYSGSSNEVGVTITQILSNGSAAGFIVSGSTNYDPVPEDDAADGFDGITALFVRFENDCRVYQGVWTKHRSSGGDDYCTKAVQIGELNSPDPFLLFGYTNSSPTNESFNYWSTRINNYGGGPLLERGIIPGSPSNTNEILGSVSVKSIASGFNSYLLVGTSTDVGSYRIFIASGQTGLISPKTVPGIDLGNISLINNPLLYKVTAHSSSTHYVIAANSVENEQSDIVLTKISADGTPFWDEPVILGGVGDDYESAVYEMDNGSIIVFGTMSLGDDEQKKMALIKLNKNGRFQ